MFLSVFELFKIGIGPSSSHTVGPMVAARRFLALAAAASLPDTGRLSVSLHGSLAFTGKGHGTDRAVVLGLAGEAPDRIDPDRVDAVLAAMTVARRISLSNGQTLSFDPARDVIFDFGPALPGHSNGMSFRILDDDNNTLLAETYYSIGGGFVQTEAERAAAVAEGKQARPSLDVPYPFRNAAEMLHMGKVAPASPSPQMKRANETGAHERCRARRRSRPHLERHERLHVARPFDQRARCRAASRSSAAPPRSTPSSRTSRATTRSSRIA